MTTRKDDGPPSVAREMLRLKMRVIWSWAGWCDAWANEASFRSWVYANLISAGFALWLPIASSERLLIIVLGVLVLASELLNSAIERLADRVTLEDDDLLGRAKDAGSAGVAITAIAAGIAWIWALVGLWS